MLVALATARPFALFEAYNICAALYWKGDLLAFACLVWRQAVFSRRNNQKNFWPPSTDSFSG
jgi:hypothetical protein